MEVIRIERDDRINLIALKGRMDLAGVHAIDLRLQAETASRGMDAILDLSGVEFLASMGMGLFVQCAQALARKGRMLVLLNPKGMVATTLREAGIDQAIPVLDSLEEAVRVIRASESS